MGVTIVMRSRSGKRLLRYHQNGTVSIQSASETTVNKPLPPFLPEELIVEILLRLSVKSLLQYKSQTCIHSWSLSLWGIANCHFVSYPLKPLLDNPSISAELEPASFETRHSTSIIGSCNGLLCLRDSSGFTLWNPSIKLKSKSSPTIVAFDLFRLLYYGFGYDQVNDRYKVPAVVQNGYNLDETKTLIYTFGEKDWTTIQKFPCDPRCDPGRLGVGKFVSGTLNWIVNNKDVIVSFDLEKETYEEIWLPQYDGVNHVLYVSSNCICVSIDHSKKTVVWMMKEYGVVESWTKMMIIPHDKLTWDVRPLVVYLMPCSSRNTEFSL
ncbi:F-box/kelch-repeat protein At3g23880 [Medicago truncatula]|uniref:F-box/kelch-repeat protein At3g23880 n=1 Tax=Medicago truncatula TaxID=3880 RepID=UPI001967CFC5|nr:F-box/kelch-repeat protein At3g23880-like [Medicago truncatula]